CPARWQTRWCQLPGQRWRQNSRQLTSTRPLRHERQNVAAHVRAWRPEPARLLGQRLERPGDVSELGRVGLDRPFEAHPGGDQVNPPCETVSGHAILSPLTMTGGG